MPMCSLQFEIKEFFKKNVLMYKLLNATAVLYRAKGELKTKLSGEKYFCRG